MLSIPYFPLYCISFRYLLLFVPLKAHIYHLTANLKKGASPIVLNRSHVFFVGLSIYSLIASMLFFSTPSYSPLCAERAATTLSSIGCLPTEFVLCMAVLSLLFGFTASFESYLLLSLTKRNYLIYGLLFFFSWTLAPMLFMILFSPPVLVSLSGVFSLSVLLTILTTMYFLGTIAPNRSRIDVF